LAYGIGKLSKYLMQLSNYSVFALKFPLLLQDYRLICW